MLNITGRFIYFEHQGDIKRIDNLKCHSEQPDKYSSTHFACYNPTTEAPWAYTMRLPDTELVLKDYELYFPRMAGENSEDQKLCSLNTSSNNRKEMMNT